VRAGGRSHSRVLEVLTQSHILEYIMRLLCGVSYMYRFLDGQGSRPEVFLLLDFRNITSVAWSLFQPSMHSREVCIQRYLSAIERLRAWEEERRRVVMQAVTDQAELIFGDVVCECGCGQRAWGPRQRF